MRLSISKIKGAVCRWFRHLPYRGAGMIIFRQGNGGDEILLGLRCYDYDRGYWSIPGGEKKRGESFREATLREVEQELKNEPLVTHLAVVDWGPETLQELPEIRIRFVPFFLWNTYLLRQNQSLINWPSCHNHELSEMRWFPLQQIPARLHPLLPLTLRCFRQKLSPKRNVVGKH